MGKAIEGKAEGGGGAPSGPRCFLTTQYCTENRTLTKNDNSLKSTFKRFSEPPNPRERFLIGMAAWRSARVAWCPNA